MDSFYSSTSKANNNITVIPSEIGMLTSLEDLWLCKYKIHLSVELKTNASCMDSLGLLFHLFNYLVMALSFVIQHQKHTMLLQVFQVR